MRAVIWAAVSSRPQAELDSIDQQIADGRDWTERQGGETAAVLTVPGVTRSFIDFYDALAGLDEFLRPGEHNAYRELERLLAGRAFDVLWVRARDRLGRTDALIAGVEERCRRAGVRVHSQAMPSTGHAAGDLYTSAIERAGAQREIVELVRRNRYGMDSRAARGLPMGGPLPFGYRAQQEIVAGRLVRVAAAVPAELDAYRWLVACTLDGSETQSSMGARLAVRFPERRWTGGALRVILANPFYAGLVLRRRERNEGETAALRVMGSGAPLDDALWPEVEALLARRASGGSYRYTDAQGRRKIAVVSAGRHEPAIGLAEWLELQRLLDLRSGTRRPPSHDALWAGILRCGACGSRMVMHHGGPRPDGQGRYRNYACGRRRMEGETACSNRTLSEGKATALVVKYLRALFAARGAASEDAPVDARQVEAEVLLARELADLQAREERLTLLFETGRIDLDGFDRRATELRGQGERVAAQLAAARAALAGQAESSRRMALLGELLPELEGRLGAVDAGEANRWLHQVFRAIYLVDGAVVGVDV